MFTRARIKVSETMYTYNKNADCLNYGNLLCRRTEIKTPKWYGQINFFFRIFFCLCEEENYFSTIQFNSTMRLWCLWFFRYCSFFLQPTCTLVWYLYSANRAFIAAQSSKQKREEQQASYVRIWIFKNIIMLWSIQLVLFYLSRLHSI